MDLQTAIKTRRSIRRFTEEAMSREALAQIVELATWAPSWKNSQTTRYIAILDKTLKDQIADTAVMNFQANTELIHSAPALVVMTTVQGRSGHEKDGSFSTSLGTHWQSFDAGIAAQTFCLAAHDLGFGTCILGLFDADKVGKLIGVAADQAVSALIAVGKQIKDAPLPQRKSVDELLSVK